MSALLLVFVVVYYCVKLPKNVCSYACSVWTLHSV